MGAMVDYATRQELNEVRDDLKRDIRGVVVIVERLESGMGILAEGLPSVRDGSRADLHAAEDRLTARMNVIEEVVRQSSTDIRENREAIRENAAAIRQSREAIGELRTELGAVRADVADLRRRTP